MENILIYVAWAVAAGLIVVRTVQNRPTSGLVLCFFLGMCLNHLFGQICWDLTSVHLPYKAASDKGFEVTQYAILGWTFGVLYADLTRSGNTPLGVFSPKKHDAMVQLVGRQAVIFGALVYAVGMFGVLTYIPSLTAVASSSAGLAIGGVCLKFFVNLNSGRPDRAWLWASTILLYPVVTTVMGGFLGFGVSGVIIIVCFVLPYVRHRLVIIAVSPLVIYFGISFWVTYAAARNDIRAKVWGGQSYENRLTAVYKGVISDWEWFAPTDSNQIRSMERLNQNVLIGQAVDNMKRTGMPFAFGDTLFQVIYALIPRAIWMDKPYYAGTGGLVSRFTGRNFAKGTSVGMGPLMELYVNFGSAGVAIGFFVLGVAVAFLDVAAGSAIRLNRPVQFLYAFVPALPLMNALTYSAEAAPAIVGAVILVYVFEKFILATANPNCSGSRARLWPVSKL
jgi:hypothetical protein